MANDSVNGNLGEVGSELSEEELRSVREPAAEVDDDSDAAPLSDSCLEEVDPLMEMAEIFEKLSRFSKILESVIGVAFTEGDPSQKENLDAILANLKDGNPIAEKGTPLEDLIVLISKNKNNVEFANKLLAQFSVQDFENAVIKFALKFLKVGWGPLGGKTLRDTKVFNQLLKASHPLINYNNLLAAIGQDDNRTYIYHLIEEATGIRVNLTHRPKAQTTPKKAPPLPPQAVKRTVRPYEKFEQTLAAQSRPAMPPPPSEYVSSTGSIDKTPAGSTSDSEGGAALADLATHAEESGDWRFANKGKFAGLIAGSHPIHPLVPKTAGSNGTGDTPAGTGKPGSTDEKKSSIIPAAPISDPEIRIVKPGETPIIPPPSRPVAIKLPTVLPPPKIESAESREKLNIRALIQLGPDGQGIGGLPILEGFNSVKIGGDINSEIHVPGLLADHAEISFQQDGKIKIRAKNGQVNIAKPGDLKPVPVLPSRTDIAENNDKIEFVSDGGNITFILKLNHSISKTELVTYFIKHIGLLENRLLQQLNWSSTLDLPPYEKPEVQKLYNLYKGIINAAVSYKQKCKIAFEPKNPDPVDQLIAAQQKMVADRKLHDAHITQKSAAESRIIRQNLAAATAKRDAERALRAAEEARLAAEQMAQSADILSASANSAVIAAMAPSAEQINHDAFVKALKVANPGYTVHTIDNEQLGSEGLKIGYKGPVLIITDLATGETTSRPLMLNQEHIGSHKGASTIELPAGKKPHVATVKRNAEGGFDLIWLSGSLEPLGGSYAGPDFIPGQPIASAEYKPAQSLTPGKAFIIEGAIKLSLENNHLFTGEATKLQGEAQANELLERVIDTDATTGTTDLQDLKTIIDFANKGYIDKKVWVKKLEEAFLQMLNMAEEHASQTASHGPARYVETLALFITCPELKSFAPISDKNYIRAIKFLEEYSESSFKKLYVARKDLGEKPKKPLFGGAEKYRKDYEEYHELLALQESLKQPAHQSLIQIARFKNAGIAFEYPNKPEDLNEAAIYLDAIKEIDENVQLRKALAAFESGEKRSAKTLLDLLAKYQEPELSRLFNLDEINDFNRDLNADLIGVSLFKNLISAIATKYARECFIEAHSTQDNGPLVKEINTLWSADLVYLSQLAIPPYDREPIPSQSIAKQLTRMEKIANEKAAIAAAEVGAEQALNAKAEIARREAAKLLAENQARLLEKGSNAISGVKTAKTLADLIAYAQDFNNKFVDDQMLKTDAESWKKIKTEIFPARVKELAMVASAEIKKGQNVDANSSGIQALLASGLLSSLGEIGLSTEEITKGQIKERFSQVCEKAKAVTASTIDNFRFLKEFAVLISTTFEPLEKQTFAEMLAEILQKRVKDLTDGIRVALLNPNIPLASRPGWKSHLQNKFQELKTLGLIDGDETNFTIKNPAEIQKAIVKAL